MSFRLANTAVGLTLGVCVAVSLALGAGAWLFSVHHFDRVLESAQASALAQSDMIRVALEHQMIENDRSLIDQMVKSFGREPGVENVLLLDREGAVRYSAGDVPPAEDLRLDSATCQACHQHAPRDRATSRVIQTREGRVLRSVTPIRNQEACHGCHEPSRRINGILIVDLDVASLRADLDRDLWRMVGVSGLLSILLVGAIAGVVRVAVLRRLRRFETTARLIVGGDLKRRIPVRGDDTISWLAREFNAMADAMTTLLGEVRVQRERLETVINSIDDGIVVLDRSRTVIAANDAFLQRAGLPRSEVLGRPCHTAAGSMCPAEDCPARRCFAEGRREVRICVRAAPDGSPRHEEIHASPIRDASGTVAYVVEVWRDISERRSAEARLAESHRLASLGMLASGFSHEMNTPLNSVLTCVEAILRRLPDAASPTDQDLEDVRDSSRIAREQLLRCRGITQQFLRLSRGNASGIETVDVGRAAQAVCRLMEPTAREHRVEVRADAGAEGVRVRANEAELQQVLLNLLLNAVQACAAGGQVTLAVEAGDPVVVRVADTGCGIEPAHLQRIFEPFFSLRDGGTGLGLFLSLDFVRGWGGDLQVTSEPGRGSTFEVRLPREA